MSDLIIVALDGSESSLRALDTAIELAAPLAKTLVLVHVIDWSPFVIETFEENEHRGAIRKNQVERATTEVVAPAEERAAAAGVTAQQEILFGAPAEEIVKQAEAKAASAIIIGRTGRSRLERMMYGSIANKIIQISEVPVVVVP
ncbi:MAG: universal stress protein [Pseudomonadota bacterium]